MKRNKVEGTIDQIERFVDKLPHLPVGNSTLEKELFIENHRLWWFYKVRFLRDMFPPQFDNFRKIAHKINNQTGRGILSRLRNKLKVLFFRKFLFFNEFLKLQVARRLCKRPDYGAKDILTSIHTNAVLRKGNQLKVDRIERVIAKIRQDNKLSLDITIIAPISHFVSLGLRTYPNLFYSYIDNDIKRKSTQLALELNKKWNELKHEINISSKSEKNIYDLLLPSLEFFFSREMISLVATYYYTYQKIMLKKNARGLVLYECGGIIERCAMAAADSLSIPSFRIYHGLGVSNLEWDYPKKHYWFVYGDLLKEHLIENLNAPADNIIVSGPVILGDYTAPAKTSELPAKRKKCILFLTNTLIEDNVLDKEAYFDYIERYIRELQTIDNAQIILKPHPREKHAQEYYDLVDKLPLKNISIESNQTKEILSRLINDCDVVVSFFSTALFEANLLGKPTLLIDLYDTRRIDKYGYFYNNSKAILKINPEDNIAPIVKKILFDVRLGKKLVQLRKEMLKKYILLGGDAAERVYRAIKVKTGLSKKK